MGSFWLGNLGPGMHETTDAETSHNIRSPGPAGTLARNSIVFPGSTVANGMDLVAVVEELEDSKERLKEGAKKNEKLRSELKALRTHSKGTAPLPLSVKDADLAVQRILRNAGLDGSNHQINTSLAGQGIFPAPNPAAFRKRIKHPRLDVDILAENHHFQYGGAWLKGRDQFDYLVQQGLMPHHKFLELGCGTLRASLWIIEYLEPGGFYCLEASVESIRAGVMYELRLHGLLSKDPHLAWSENFNLSQLVPDMNVHFDFAFAFSVFIHICGGCRDRLCGRGLLSATKLLKPGGKLIVNKKNLEERTDLTVFGLTQDPVCEFGPAHFTRLPDYYCTYKKFTPNAPTGGAWRTAITPIGGKLCFNDDGTNFTIPQPFDRFDFVNKHRAQGRVDRANEAKRRAISKRPECQHLEC